METKSTYSFYAFGTEQVVELDALLNPADVTDPEYHKFLTHHYAAISELRGQAKVEWSQAKLATEKEFNLRYLAWLQHYETQARRPTREHLRACVETEDQWMALRQAELAAEANYEKAQNLCNSLWFHVKMVQAYTAGLAQVVIDEIKRGGR